MKAAKGENEPIVSKKRLRKNEDNNDVKKETEIEILIDSTRL